ncbi:MAG: peptidoglycan-associated lipoprotein Pal [Methylophilaceae bacterium]|nr:peptidoglycan-associated lipoprotein Pal [Methylophilaceae bacterium]
MNKHLIGSVLLSLLLGACSSSPIKDLPKVEDKSPASANAGVAPEASGAQTSGQASDSSSSVNPLKDPNNILSKRSVYFDFDKYEVKSEYRPVVDAHAKYLLEHPAAKVTLQGNCDDRGSREYNLALGQRRSVAVKKVLNLSGVQDKQIETVSYGEEKAHTNCADETCFAQDRRADVFYENE